jgi:hypothetical protein
MSKSKFDTRPIQEVLEDIRQAELEKELDERASLVADIPTVIKVVLKDIQAKLEKELRKGQTEIANNVARLVGLKVTTKGQKKNKAFMYDLTKGHKGSFRK